MPSSDSSSEGKLQINQNYLFLKTIIHNSNTSYLILFTDHFDANVETNSVEQTINNVIIQVMGEEGSESSDK